MSRITLIERRPRKPLTEYLLSVFPYLTDSDLDFFFSGAMESQKESLLETLDTMTNSLSAARTSLQSIK